MDEITAPSTVAASGNAIGPMHAIPIVAYKQCTTIIMS